MRAWLDVRERELFRDVRNDRSRVRRHIECDPIGSIPLRKLDREGMRAWLRRLIEKGLSASSMRNVATIVRVALESAVEAGFLEDNPARTLRLPRGVRVRMTPGWDVLDPGEQRKLLRRAALQGAWVYTAIAVAMGTGLRRRELLSLRWTDIVWESAEGPYLNVSRGRRGGPTKSGRPRRVPLFGLALQALGGWRAGAAYRGDAGHGEAERVIGAALGTRPIEVQPIDLTIEPEESSGVLVIPAGIAGDARDPIEDRRALFNVKDVSHAQHGSALVFPGPRGLRDKVPDLRPLLAGIGVTRRIRWQDLRHTCATSLYEGWWGRAWSLQEIGQLLGHRHYSTTERYAHQRGTLVFRAAREMRG